MPVFSWKDLERLRGKQMATKPAERETARRGDARPTSRSSEGRIGRQRADVQAQLEKHEQGVQWMLNSILGLALIAICASAFYGWQYSLKGAILAALASSLGYTIGGISGFLFGFPRYTDTSAISNAAEFQAAANSSNRGMSALRHNTNLERITDWLMTLIVGATLVNLLELVAWADAQFKAITAAIVYSAAPDFPDAVDVYSTPGAVLVMPFVAAGFLHMYMWARKYLLPEWMAQDKALQENLRMLEQQTTRQQEALERLKTSVYGVDPTYLTRQKELLERLHVSAELNEDVIARYEASTSWNDDPFLDFAPSENEGFRLSATVTEDEVNKSNPYRVEISIARKDGQAFSASIVLLLHNSFRSPVIADPTFNGALFKQTITCADSFALGAIVVLDGTFKNIPLSLNLERLANLPEGFIATEENEGPTPRTSKSDDE